MVTYTYADTTARVHQAQAYTAFTSDTGRATNRLRSQSPRVRRSTHGTHHSIERVELNPQQLTVVAREYCTPMSAYCIVSICQLLL